MLMISAALCSSVCPFAPPSLLRSLPRSLAGIYPPMISLAPSLASSRSLPRWRLWILGCLSLSNFLSFLIGLQWAAGG